MKKIALLILCLSLLYCPVFAKSYRNCGCQRGNLQPNNSYIKQSGLTKQVADDDNTQQNENEELQEYRSDLDESEDSGDTNEYGYDGSDGSTKSN